MKNSKKYVRTVSAALCSLLLLSSAPALADTYATVRGGGLNLRQTASLDAKVLGQYPTGTWVTIHEQGDTWSRVTVNGKSGYMMKKFISVVGSSSGAASTLPKAPFTAKLVNPNGNGIVNFRKAPGLSASIIKAYPIGTEIQVTEVGDVWCKATIDGTEGYVSRYFFQVVK